MDSTQLARHLAGSLSLGHEHTSPMPEGDAAINCTAVDLLQLAVIVKYGPNNMESAFKFIEESSAIITKYGLSENAPPPSLQQKLDALKANVGEENFKLLLANPEVERMGARALRKDAEAKTNLALKEISALFNHAIDPYVLSMALRQVSIQEDQVGFLADF